MRTRSTTNGNRRIPYLGHGVGLRREFFKSIFETERRIDWLEIIPEVFLKAGGELRQVLRRAAERWTVVPHCVSLSLGGPDPLDRDLLFRLRDLCREVRAPWVSTHLCFTSAGGAMFHGLLPLSLTAPVARHAASRARQIEDILELPLLIENISTYAIMPGSTMTEAQFIAAVLEEASAGLLLDVNNVFVSAHNNRYNPYDFLASIPFDRVGQIHLAGHDLADDLCIDDHGSVVSDAVWALYEAAVSRTGDVSTLIEWDSAIPPLPTVLDEADKARARAARIASQREGRAA